MKSLKALSIASITLFFASCASDDNTYTRSQTREPGISIPGGGGPINDDPNGDLNGLGAEDGFVDAELIDQALNDTERGTPVAHDIEPVYFAFDSAAVRSAENQKIESIAMFLQENDAYTLVIGGHCDERGSDEYNRSLSEKRALAVKDALLAFAPDMEVRIDTVAYGEEKPAVLGNDGQSYSKNRRAEFEVYQAN